MEISKRVQTALQRLGQNKTLRKALFVTTVAGYGLLSGNTVQAQSQTQDANGVRTSDVIPAKTPVKHYKNIVEVNSLDEIYIGQREAAVYNDLIDAVIYTQYKMNGANKTEQDQIDFINNSNYSVNTENHELQHRNFKLKNISSKLYDGSCVMKISDRIRARIMEEVLCCKAQNNYPSIMDAIQDFKTNHKDDTYASHYGEAAGERSGSVLVGLIAEDKVPEKVSQNFVRTSSFKAVKIGDQEYLANKYVSQDKKYQTYILHNTNDDVVRSPEIIAQSSVAIGTICTVDGKEIKTADGKAIKASYAGEGYNKHGGWAGYAVLAVDNVSKKTEGYTFNKAEANFDRICQEYAAAAELTTAEAKALKEFVTGMTSLNSYDLSDKEIKEIRDNYKDSSFEKEAIKIKANYEEGVALSRDKFIRDQLPHLVEVTPPSVLSFQKEAQKQMTAQKSKAAKQKGG